MKTAEKQTPSGLELHLIVDNYATHKHEKVRNWIKRNKRVHLHFIPTSSSWLNLVERFFGLLPDKQLRRGVFNSVRELEKNHHKIYRDAQRKQKAIFMDEIYGRDFSEG